MIKATLAIVLSRNRLRSHQLRNNDDENELHKDDHNNDKHDKNPEYVTFGSSKSNNNRNSKDFALNLDKMKFCCRPHTNLSRLFQTKNRFLKSLTVKDLLQVLHREQDAKAQLEYLALEVRSTDWIVGTNYFR
jgi:hypothetical protein